MNHIRILFLTASLSFLFIPPEAAGVSVESYCLSVGDEREAGCPPRAGNQSQNLLRRRTDGDGVTLVWTLDSATLDDTKLILYSGNPSIANALSTEEVVFEEQDGKWTLTRTFDSEELGLGTFVTVLVEKSRRDSERILEWRAWRLVSDLEMQRAITGPERTSGWVLEIQPAYLHVETAHGTYPRSRGGEELVWWPLAPLDGLHTDLDIDGDRNGAAGIGVHVSTPWISRGDSDSILNSLLRGHSVKFDGNLEWVENEPPRTSEELCQPSEYVDSVRLRSFYTAITLFTNASVSPMRGHEVGASFGANRIFYAHETSAAGIRQTRDPRFWSSYSRRELTSDPRLLKLLRKQLEKNEPVPGLPEVKMVGGDGGTVRYSVGFIADILTWSSDSEFGQLDDEWSAGIVGVDIVASRQGIGAITTTGSLDNLGIGDKFCELAGCNNGSHSLDLNNPPEGWTSYPATSSPSSISGQLFLTSNTPLVGARNVSPSCLEFLEDEGRFAMSADLRAGALVRQSSVLKYTEAIVPVDAYAQYVLKVTVAMRKNGQGLINDDAILPDRKSLDTSGEGFEEKAEFWMSVKSFLTRFWQLSLMAGLIVILLLFPGFRNVINALLNRLARRIDP